MNGRRDRHAGRFATDRSALQGSIGGQKRIVRLTPCRRDPAIAQRLRYVHAASAFGRRAWSARRRWRVSGL